MSGPCVFLDISFENSPSERIIIEVSMFCLMDGFEILINGPTDILQLYAEPALAVETFRALCVGDKGIVTATGKPLHYKGCQFYLVFKGFAVEAGDFKNQDGTNGESIYGGTFSDENLETSISGRGIIMMQNHGSNFFGSQFLICLRHHPSLDRCNVAIGKVIKGMKTIELIDRLATPDGKPYLRSIISDCGEIVNDNIMIFDEPQSSSVGEEEVEENENVESLDWNVEFLELSRTIKEVNSQLLKLIVDEEKENWLKVKWPVIAAVSSGAAFLLSAFFCKRVIVKFRVN